MRGTRKTCGACRATYTTLFLGGEGTFKSFPSLEEVVPVAMVVEGVGDLPMLGEVSGLKYVRRHIYIECNFCYGHVHFHLNDLSIAHMKFF